MKKSRARQNPAAYSRFYHLQWSKLVQEAVDYDGEVVMVCGHTHHEYTGKHPTEGVEIINLPAGVPVELEV